MIVLIAQDAKHDMRGIGRIAAQFLGLVLGRFHRTMAGFGQWEFVAGWLRSHGVPAAAVQSALNGTETARVVERDIQLGFGWKVRGTPTIFINGRRMDMFSEPLLDAILRQELHDAGLSGHEDGPK